MKTMQSYIDRTKKIRNSEPLFSGEELRGILTEKTRSPHNFLKKNRWSRVMKIFFAGALLAGLSGTALWYNQTEEKISSQGNTQDLLNTDWVEKKISPEKILFQLDERNPSSGLVNSKLSAEKNSFENTDPMKLQPREGFVLKPTAGAIRGIRVIELNDDELRKIGINHTSKGYEFVSEVKNFGALLRFKNTIDTFKLLPEYPGGMTPDEIIPFGEESRIQPLVLTHQFTGEEPGQYGSICITRNGMKGLLDEVGTMQEEHERSRWHPDKYRNVVGTLSEKYPIMSRLIPVHIPFKKIDAATGREKILANATFWFAPTEEFVSALPERYREPLIKELALMRRIEKNELTSEEVCEVIRGEPTFFDICRMENGVVKDVSVYPNPVQPNSKCVFTLDEPRNVMITLHNTNGVLLKMLADGKKFQAGPHEIPLEFRDTPAGAYLVAVMTERGEKAVFRVLVP